MPKINVYVFEADAIRGVLSGTYSWGLDMEVLASVIDMASEEDVLILPGPDGHPNVEVPQEGWLD